MGVNNPERAFFWDTTTKSWRKAVYGEPGEFVWDNSTNAWVKGTLGAEYKWDQTTQSWIKGPGGQYVWNSTTKAWDKVTTAGYGGQFYWSTSANAWVQNVGGNPLDAYGSAAFVFDTAASYYRNGTAITSSFSSLTGLTFTRALAAYAPNSAGVLQLFSSGAPRITDRGLLIEGARTNLCLRSQEFDNASWAKTNITVTADAIAAPDGTLTADLCTVTTSAATNFLQTIGAVSGTNCCASIYVLNNNRVDTATSYFLYDVTTAANRVACVVNWAAMTVSGTGASIERLGSTNWYRIILIDTAWTSGNTARFYVGAGGGALTAGQAWYQWGAQLEAASFPSSYIPTTTASVARPADVCSIAVSGISYPATLFAEFERVVDTGGDQGLLQIDDGSSNNRSLLNVNSGGLIQMYVRSASVDQASNTIAGALALNTTYRAAIRIATNDAILSRSGLLGTQDTSVTVPATPTTIRLGQQTTSASACFGFIKRAALWPTALSDASLQAVTT